MYYSELKWSSINSDIFWMRSRRLLDEVWIAWSGKQLLKGALMADTRNIRWAMRGARQKGAEDHMGSHLKQITPHDQVICVNTFSTHSGDF